MFEPLQKTTEELQKAGQANYDAVARAQEYTESSFENATRDWEQLLEVKSLERAFELQTNYAKKAYEDWTAEVSKISEMYQAAASDAYKPFEKALKTHAA